MKKIIFRLLVVFLGQLCCLAIGLCSGALNVNNLQVKARSEQAAPAGSQCIIVTEGTTQDLSIDLTSSPAAR